MPLQSRKKLSVQASFSFFPFILNKIYWIVRITNNITKIENFKISNKSIIIITGLLSWLPVERISVLRTFRAGGF